MTAPPRYAATSTTAPPTHADAADTVPGEPGMGDAGRVRSPVMGRLDFYVEAPARVNEFETPGTRVY